MTVLNLTRIRDFKISNCFGVGGWNLALSLGGGISPQNKGEKKVRRWWCGWEWKEGEVIEHVCHSVTAVPCADILLDWMDQRGFECGYGTATRMTGTAVSSLYKQAASWDCSSKWMNVGLRNVNYVVNILDKIFMSLYYMCFISSSLGGIIGILLCFSDSGWSRI